jgi:hypothetical protein
MTAKEASLISGLSVWSIQFAASKSEFAATKPAGNKGGWDINEESFRQWLTRRRIKGGNKAYVALVTRGTLA